MVRCRYTTHYTAWQMIALGEHGQVFVSRSLYKEIVIYGVIFCQILEIILQKIYFQEAVLLIIPTLSWFLVAFRYDLKKVEFLISFPVFF